MGYVDLVYFGNTMIYYIKETAPVLFDVYDFSRLFLMRNHVNKTKDFFKFHQF